MITTKASRTLLFFGLVVGSFFVLAGGAVASMAYTHRNTFYPGVSVQGVNLSGLTQAQAQAKLATLTNSYNTTKVVVALADESKSRDPVTGEYPDITVPTTAGSLGMTFATPTALEQAWQVGHNDNISWLKDVVSSLFLGHNQDLSSQIDQSKLGDFVNGTVAAQVSVPKPATLSVQGTTVSVSDAVSGEQVNTVDLTKQLTASLSDVTSGQPLYVRANVTLTSSPITKTVVQPLADQLNALGSSTVTLSTTSLTLKPSRSDLLSWFVPVQDTAGNLSLALQQDVVAQYLKAKGGSSLDQTKSLAAVIPVLSNVIGTTTPTKVSASLVASPTAAPKVATPGNFTVGDYPGKYIEVNLKEQKLYRIDGTNMEKVYLISSGKASTPTPTGTFTINGHALKAWSALYGLWMPFWMNFLNNQYGIHELPVWPSGYREGEGHLGIPVSDGCIRLGIGEAEELYNWTPDGTPVIIRAS